MPETPAAEFDAAWYVEAYADVTMSGLDPWDHYARFGRAMGRSGGPSRPAPKNAAKPAARPVDRAAAAKDSTRIAQAPARAAAPIVDRPAGFDPGAGVPRPAAARAEVAQAGHLLLASLAQQVVRAGLAVTEGEGAVAAYARMFGLPGDSTGAPADPVVSFVPGQFRSGAAGIDSAWHADAGLLRVMLHGEPGEGPVGEGWSLRAYQARPAAPDRLLPAGGGICLPASGPVFWDLELADPYMPILIELSDREDAMRAVALLPFPSLLPGGRHGAELKALQPLSNPVEAFWSLGRTYLSQHLDARSCETRAIAEVVLLAPDEHQPEHARPQTRQVDTALAAWLAALFQVQPRESAGTAELVAGSQASGAAAGRGAQLCLPADCIPTIAILVRRAPLGQLDGARGGPFLVVDLDDNRPRWSVSLPATLAPVAGQPFLLSAGVPASGGGSPSGSVPVHLGIAFRRRPALELLSRPAKPAAASVPGPASEGLDILLDATDAAQLKRAVGDLKALGLCGDRAIGVRLPLDGAGCRGLLDRLCGAGRWIEIASHHDLRQAAQMFSGERLLSLSDRIELGDGAILGELWSICESDRKVASASCLLVSDRVVKKKTVLEPAAGGLFPAGVSLIRSPRIGFSEPDVTLALQGARYPVAANTWHFALWRRDALASLPPVEGQGSGQEAEIGLGLDLMAAGYSSICTARLSARIRGQFSRCDAIDPIGGFYGEFAPWEAILNRVTLIRELYS